jgi:hypothetical protein
VLFLAVGFETWRKARHLLLPALLEELTEALVA